MVAAGACRGQVFPQAGLEYVEALKLYDGYVGPSRKIFGSGQDIFFRAFKGAQHVVPYV